jgi:hypothetical protein
MSAIKQLEQQVPLVNTIQNNGVVNVANRIEPSGTEPRSSINATSGNCSIAIGQVNGNVSIYMTNHEKGESA